MLDTGFAPFLPACENHFRVRPGLKSVAAMLELRAQLAKIVNLSIEDQTGRTIWAKHGLVTCNEVNDCEASVSKSNSRYKVIAIAVWPPVGNGVRHRTDDQ